MTVNFTCSEGESTSHGRLDITFFKPCLGADPENIHTTPKEVIKNSVRGCKCKCKCKFNVKHRECLRNHLSQRLMIKCLTIPDRIGIRKSWSLRRGENWSTRRKTSRSKEENQQQTQPTYDAGSGNRTQHILVGGKRSHHCGWRYE